MRVDKSYSRQKSALLITITLLTSLGFHLVTLDSTITVPSISIQLHTSSFQDMYCQQLLLLGELSSPVSLDSHKDLLWVEGSTLMIHYLTLPPHSLCYALDLRQNIHGVPQDHCSFWPQYPVQLQQYV